MAIPSEPSVVSDARESRVWRVVLTVFLRGAPPPLMRAVRRSVPAAPIEEFVIQGRRTGRERRMLLGLFEVDGAWYAGHPNGSSQWVRNLEAAGGCTVIRRDGLPVAVSAVEVAAGAERDAVIRATGRQPAPAGAIYRGARRHIRAVGRYFHLEPIAQRALALAVATLLAVGLLGCGGPASPSAASPRTTGTPAPTATFASHSPTPAPQLTYLAFGDSWPFGSHCNGCRPFPVLLRDGFAATTGASIRFVNDVTNGGTAEELAAEMAADAGIRADIAAADIIVIAIGGNDFEPAFEAWESGSCGGADQLECFRAVRDTLRAAYEAMLTEIDGLRGGRPTAVRMVTTSNEFLADPALIELFGPAFGAAGGVAVTTMNRDAQCEVAAAHDAICIDLGKALNGPNLTTPQDVNTQEAMQKVADAILAAGLPELRSR